MNPSVPVHPDLLTDGDFPVDFGEFRLIGVLGEGGMARVFEAELIEDGGVRQVAALKVIHAVVADHRIGLAESLAQEARLGGLLRHPNVVQTYDFGDTDGHPWISMELIDGVRLDELLLRYGRLPPDVVLEIGVQICDGLSHAHDLLVDGQKATLIHRDLKPSNVMISRAGQVKVMDFGIAKATNMKGVVTEAGHTKGTPAYMSPEQTTAAQLDGRSDLFAVGALLFEMAAGFPFFEGDSVYEVMAGVLQVEDKLRMPGAMEPADGWVPGLGEVCRRCLRAERELRFSGAPALRHELRAIQAQRPAAFPLETWLRQVLDDPTDEIQASALSEALEDEPPTHSDERVAALGPMSTEPPTVVPRPSTPPPPSAASQPHVERPPTASQPQVERPFVGSVPEVTVPPIAQPPPSRPFVRPDPEPSRPFVASQPHIAAPPIAQPPPSRPYVRPPPRKPAEAKRPAYRSPVMQALVVFFVGLLILLLVGLTVLLVRTAHEESPPPEAVPLDELEILVEDDLSDATPRPPVSKGRPAQPDKGAPAPTVRPTPRTAPDPTPRTAPDPTPRTAPDPTPRPTATPTPRPGAVLGTDEPETPVPTARVTIGHQAPASALLGSPNPLRFRLEPAEAPCRLVLFHASWPPGADGYDSLRLSPVGGGAWEGELFVPYAPEYRNGFRYRASCVAADGAELAAWPASGGTHPVPALAR